ncbi:unnamed protein product [Rotaria sordida]|uniref:Transmembrane 9 superfamily member n=2 Tax=Rotaria sordida TaxID=392033 RepID=A0A814JE23_9BILA|nr:unnamed protein product [Rotaria sordida]
MLLAVLIGNGVQIAIMSLITLIFACLGFLSPASRGALMTCAIVCYVLLGTPAGYTSARLYKMFGGERWKKNVLMTAVACPGFIFGIFFVLNLVLWANGSSAAIPFTTFLALLALWFCVSTPLVFIGAYLGFKRPVSENPVRTNQIPRQVPEQTLYTKPIPVKNFKRHCERQHSSINTEEKYKKQLVKLKEKNEQLLLSSSPTEHHREQSSTGVSDVCSVTDTGTNTSSTCSTINETVQLTSINEPAQLTSIINESVQLSSIINEPAQLTSIINESVQLSSIINEPAQLTSIINEPVQPSSIVDKPVQLSSINIENNDQMIQIKNKICGGVKYLIHQTNQCSSLVKLSVDPDLSDKYFIVQIVSYLKLIQGSATDLINECNYASQKMPTLETTIHEIQSSEITTSRDPSFKKDFNEKELRYLVNEGPYQPLLTKFPDNELLKKKKDTCHFVKKWYQEYPLIEYSPITNAAYCFSCRLFGDGPGNGREEDA